MAKIVCQFTAFIFKDLFLQIRKSGQWDGAGTLGNPPKQIVSLMHILQLIEYSSLPQMIGRK